MCDSDAGDQRHPHVRLMRCHHGVYHLTVGPVTLRLTEEELAFVGRAVLLMSNSQSALRAKLAADGDLTGAGPADTGPA